MLSKWRGEKDENRLISQLEDLLIMFDLRTEELRLTESLIGLIREAPINWEAQMTQLVKSCLKNREGYEERDAVIERSQCKVSKMETNMLVASKGTKFHSKVVVKCMINPLLSKEARTEYRRLAEL